MRAKPGIVIIGAGNLGTAIAQALRASGYPITLISRSQKNGFAKRTGVRVRTELSSSEHADVIWFCVPDSEIAGTAARFAGTLEWKGKVVLHSSGALTSDELAALRRRGATVASLHPLMTFVRRSSPSLVGVSFAVEGDLPAVRIARRIVRDLGGRSYPIRKQDKAAYHAWGTFVSPLFTALLATSEKVAALAGIKERAARERMTPILRQTLANYSKLDAAASFSGPIIRGDAETVRRHLTVLRKLPKARDVYISLARTALDYLPARNKRPLKSLLDQAIGDKLSGAPNRARRIATPSKASTTNGRTAAVRRGKANTALE